MRNIQWKDITAHLEWPIYLKALAKRNRLRAVNRKTLLMCSCVRDRRCSCMFVDVRVWSSMFVHDRRCSWLIVDSRAVGRKQAQVSNTLDTRSYFSLTSMGAARVYACTSSLATTTTQLNTCTVDALKICQTLRNHTIKLALSMLIFGSSGRDMLWIFMLSSVSKREKTYVMKFVQPCYKRKCRNFYMLHWRS